MSVCKSLILFWSADGVYLAFAKWLCPPVTGLQFLLNISQRSQVNFDCHFLFYFWHLLWYIMAALRSILESFPTKIFLPVYVYVFLQIIYVRSKFILGRYYYRNNVTLPFSLPGCGHRVWYSGCTSSVSLLHAYFSVVVGIWCLISL